MRDTWPSFPASTTIVAVHPLAINNIQGLEEVFSNLLLFTVPAVVVGVRLSIRADCIHCKRGLALLSEMGVSVEADPYDSKITSSKGKEVYSLHMIANTDLAPAMARGSRVLTSDTESESRTRNR